MRAVSYRRVSTEEQAAEGYGLDAQHAAVTTELARRSWTHTADHVDHGVSGAISPQDRPGLTEALHMLAKGEAEALVVAKLDRATRSVADLCWLLDLADKQKWDLVALDLGIDTSTPMGRAMAQMAGVFSELERKMIGQRTKAALAVKKANGERLGRPVTLDEQTRRRILRSREDGLSLRAIAEDLSADAVPTSTGGRWHHSTVRAVLESIALDDARHKILAERK